MYLCTMREESIVNGERGCSSIRARACVCVLYGECKWFCMSVKGSLRRGEQ